MHIFLKYKYHLLLFFIISFLIYFPMFSNGFVSDDQLFILETPELHHFNISIFFDNIYLNNSVFRLTTVTYLSFLYTIFGAHATAYHVIQLILHVVATIFIFILFSKHFNSKHSFFAALLFLVHPVNAEAVLWISSVQSQILTITGVGGLLLAQSKQLTDKKLLFLGVLFLFLLITNENGIIYIAIIFIYRKIFNLDKIKRLGFVTIYVLILYAFLRFINGATSFYIYQFFPIGSLSLLERVSNIPVILFYYIKQFIYPIDLIFLQTWIINNYLTKLYIGSLLTLSLLFYLYWKSFVHIKNNSLQCKTFYFYSLWLLLFMVPLMQIVPISMTVSDRWFYLPLPGLLGVLLVLLDEYKLKAKKYMKILLVLLTIVFVLFAYRTHMRTYDWKDDLTLVNHDLQYQPNSELLNYDLAQLYIEKGKYKESIPHLVIALQHSQKHLYYYYLGDCYRITGKFGEAITMYRFSIKQMENIPQKDKFIEPYIYLSQLYLQLHRPKEVVNLLSDKILFARTSIPLLFIVRGSAEIELKQYTKAMNDAEFVRANAPSDITSNFYTYVQDMITKSKNEK